VKSDAEENDAGLASFVRKSLGSFPDRPDRVGPRVPLSVLLPGLLAALSVVLVLLTVIFPDPDSFMHMSLRGAMGGLAVLLLIFGLVPWHAMSLYLWSKALKAEGRRRGVRRARIAAVVLAAPYLVSLAVVSFAAVWFELLGR